MKNVITLISIQDYRVFVCDSMKVGRVRKENSF